MKDYLAPFALAFILCGIAFLALDITMMNLQGLSLIFHS